MLADFFCWLILFIVYLSSALAQDIAIYGVYEFAGNLITPRKKNEIYSKCFQGLSFTSCSPVLVDDDVVLNYDLAYYRNLASLQGQFYCVQCCGNSPDYVDTWNLECTMDPPSIASLSSFFGFELRLARKASLTDTEIVTCPFTRSQCSFAGDIPVCDRTNDTYIHGYTLTIEVEQLDQNFAFWNSVTKCAFSDIEEHYYPLQPGQTFRETIILKHRPVDSFSVSDFGKVAIICVTCFIVVYIALYFFRRKRCEYCQQKLVFSPRLCYKCVLVGAQPPDPVLLKALEERGMHMQGKPPERLGCLQTNCVGCVRCLYNCMTCRCCCGPCAWCCRTCCCCCKCCHCCEPKPAPRIIPDDIDSMNIEEIAAMEGALKMERADVEDFDEGSATGPESEEPSKSKKSKSKKDNGKSISFAAKDKSKKSDAKKKKNPNILDYPKETIYKAVKHPIVY